MSDWGISAGPSVHSRDLWLKLSCENMVSVVGKAANYLCVWDFVIVCWWLGHVCEIERSALRGLGGIFIHLAWQSVTKAASFYMERLSYSSSAEFSARGSKLWCRFAHGWLSLCSQFAAAGTCLLASLFSRREESRDGRCTGHVPSTSVWCQGLAKAAILQSWAKYKCLSI